MTATVIDGNAIAQQIRDEVKREIDELKRHDVEPGLAFVLVGENPASVSYVRGKSRDAIEIGMRSETIRLPEDTTQDRLLSVLRELNADRRWHGVLVQVPLTPQLRELATAAAVAVDKDVVGLNTVRDGRQFRGVTV